jgi:hypothetical protein
MSLAEHPLRWKYRLVSRQRRKEGIFTRLLSPIDARLWNWLRREYHRAEFLDDTSPTDDLLARRRHALEVQQRKVAAALKRMPR